ncbi:MAG: CpsB/CapC family capsule biosynthesis tyrosine phosphatase [Pseudomonadota bacterium]
MIDLHCHMLPGIDDGAPDLATALEMARIAVADGITVTACTPHIYQGMFDNTHEGIREACDSFRSELAKAAIPLQITYGADIQIVPDLVEGLDNGRLPTLNGGRYFLFEPPHHIAPPGMLDLVHSVLVAGYVPVITHPERLSYVEDYYEQFRQAHAMGAWLQLTGGSVIGRFGKHVQQISRRFLSDGLTHLLASDAHNTGNRDPELSEAREAAAELVGAAEAERLVLHRPQAIIDNADPVSVPAPEVVPEKPAKLGLLQRLFG